MPQHLPSKFNQPGSIQQLNNTEVSQTPQAMQNGVHNIIMSGSPVNTHAHFPHQTVGQNSTPRSPPVASTYANGINRHPNQPNGYTHQPPNQSFQPPPFMVNGYQQINQHPPPQSYSAYQSYRPPQNAYQPPQKSHQNQQPAGWSARYVPPPSQLQPPSPHGPPPADLNPFANTLNDHRPTSSHGPISSHGHSSAFSSPLRNAPALSHSQYQTPASSFNARPPSSSATPQINGFATNNLAAHQPVGPPVQSPKKQASPPSARPTHQFPHAPSPVGHQPALPVNGPTSPGFSPVKHSSPQHLMPVNADAVEPSAAPPRVKLAPSAIPQQLKAAIEPPISERPVGTQEPERQSSQP